MGSLASKETSWQTCVYLDGFKKDVRGMGCDSDRGQCPSFVCTAMKPHSFRSPSYERCIASSEVFSTAEMRRRYLELFCLK